MSATLPRKSHWVRNLCLVAGVCFAGLAGLLAIAVGQARDAAHVSTTSCRLKALGLAVHNYADTELVLPAGATLAVNGTPLYGWTVPLLPYLDQQALYDSIDRAQASDAPANRAAFQTTVKGLQTPLIHETEAGGWPVSHFAGNVHVLRPGKSLSLEAIPDGISNTVLLGTAAGDFVPWGSPDNLRDPALGMNAGPKSFGCPGRDGAFFLNADGSVRIIRKQMDPQVLKALGTPDGHESISPRD